MAAPGLAADLVESLPSRDYGNMNAIETAAKGGAAASPDGVTDNPPTAVADVEMQDTPKGGQAQDQDVVKAESPLAESAVIATGTSADAPAKVEPTTAPSTPPRGPSMTAIRARTRSTSPPSGPASIATAPSINGKASASPSIDGNSQTRSASEAEVDKDKLLATIEMTKKANLLQQRLALAGFKAQHGWSELSLGDIEPKLATIPPPAQSPGLAPPATPLRKRKSHTSLSIASPTDRDAPIPFRSPTRGSFPQGSPLRSAFPTGLRSPTTAGFASPGSLRDRRMSASGRPRVAYVSPHKDRRPSSSYGELGANGLPMLQPPLSPTSPDSPRKRSRTGNSPESPGRPAQHRTFVGSVPNGTGQYARRGSDPSRSPSPPLPSKRFMDQHRRSVAVPYGLDYVAEEQGSRTAAGQSSSHRRVSSTSGASAGNVPPLNGRHLHPLTISPSLPPPRSYRDEHRKKQRSQSHSGFHLMHGQAAELPPSTDAMDVDAANALTSMLGSGSSRGNSPAFSPTTSFATPRFPDSLESAPISPASNLALRNSVAAQKPRSQSFAAMSRKFSGSGSPSPSLSAARPYAQAPASNARGGHSSQSSRRPSDDAALDDQESEDEAKEAAELMIFLAQSPSPARNVARKRSAQHLSGTPGGVGRVLFEESTGTHAGENFSPSRFANLMIHSPREEEFAGRDQPVTSAAGDRMRQALESGARETPKALEPHKSSGASSGPPNQRLDEVSRPQPHSAATSVDSGDEPVTPTSSAVRSHEGFAAPGVKA